jgi:integrase/recombinase XerD
VFRRLREELGVEVARAPKKLPYVPTKAEIRAFYHAVWKARRASDVILIKTLLSIGVRVSEFVRIRIADVDHDTCRIRITRGNGRKDRVVPFPAAFKETLSTPSAGRRGVPVRVELEEALQQPRRPQDRRPLRPGSKHHRLDQPARPPPFPVHVAVAQGIDDALNQPYGGHAIGQSLEIYSRFALADAQQRYDDAIGDFPV